MFQPSIPPGREAPSPSQPAAPSQPSQGAPDAPAGGGSMFNPQMILMLALPILLVVLMTRSQSKKQKQLEASLKLGDEVVTQSGMIGKLIEMNERTVRVEVAPGVKISMLKTAIQGQHGAAAEGDKSASTEKAEKKA